MIDDNTNRLLMSDSIKGMVPSLEEDVISKFEDAFVIAALNLEIGDESRLVTGALDGISYDSSNVKIDIRLPIKDAYSLIQATTKLEVKCLCCFLSYSDEETVINGPFKVASAKLYDFDRENKICTLGLDLI